MKRLALTLLIALAACDEVVIAPPPPAVEPTEIDFDKDNLLNLARGAAVVSRTGELSLENSAAHAIDGDWLTFFKSPYGGPQQTLVYSLPARSRITRVGVIAASVRNEAPAGMKFEASDDGVAWRAIGTIPVQVTTERQLVDVTPFEARYLRVQPVETADSYSNVRSIYAIGTEVAPPVLNRIEGCWTINGLPARFVQKGESVAGVIGNDPPMFVTGGTDGRITRLMWLRNAQWGHALVTIEPQRRALSGVRWHEQVKTVHSGDAWFGTPAADDAACRDLQVDEVTFAAALALRAGQWMMYAKESEAIARAVMQRVPDRKFTIVPPDAARKSVNQPQRVLTDARALRVQ